MTEEYFRGRHRRGLLKERVINSKGDFCRDVRFRNRYDFNDNDEWICGFWKTVVT